MDTEALQAFDDLPARVVHDTGIKLDLYGIKELFTDDYINLVISDTGDAIRNYCNINNIPKALYAIWSSMATEYLKYIAKEQAVTDPNGSVTANVDTETKMQVTSGREGSVQVDLSPADGSTSSVTAKSRVYVDTEGLSDVVLNYTNQLNRFRRITW